MTETEVYFGTGRRKCAVARVRIKPGSGEWKINGKPLEETFARAVHKESATMPLRIVSKEGQFDIWVRACGGGQSGWADAIKLGLARALEQYDSALRGPLKAEGCLRRDPREKERKKYGQKRARKKFQFSKR